MIKNSEEDRSRLAESIETSLYLSDGLVEIEEIDEKVSTLHSSNFSCSQCGYSVAELEPRMFSFNNPYGAPYGLLKENILGSSSATEYPHCEQEKLDECSVETFSSISSISTSPSERYREVSIDSASLDLSSSEFLITKRSTTAEISCFLFLSNSGNSSIGYTTSFTLTLT